MSTFNVLEAAVRFRPPPRHTERQGHPRLRRAQRTGPARHLTIRPPDQDGAHQLATPRSGRPTPNLARHRERPRPAGRRRAHARTGSARQHRPAHRSRSPLPAITDVPTPALPFDLHPPAQHRADLDQAQLTDEISDAVRIDLRSHPGFASPVDSCHISHHADCSAVRITLQNCWSSMERATGIEPA
jgi:hypothetical protein